MLTALALSLLPSGAAPLEIPSEAVSLGSSRQVGLAGALTAWPDGPAAAWINPAVAAPERALLLDTTLGGWLGPTVGLLTPDDAEPGPLAELGRLDFTQDADRTQAVYGGVSVGLAGLGLTVSARHLGYQAPVDRDPPLLRTNDTQLAALLGASRGWVSLGAGLLGHTDRVCVAPDDDGCGAAGRTWGMSPVAGLVVRAVPDRLRIGLAAQSRSAVLAPSDVRPVRLPWELGLGLAARAGAWWYADARLTLPSPDASTLAHPDRRGLPATLQVAGALEYPVGESVVLRHGAYVEPGRDPRVPPRPHLTGGLDIVWDGPLLVLFTGVTAAFDVAPPTARWPTYLQLQLSPMILTRDSRFR